MNVQAVQAQDEVQGQTITNGSAQQTAGALRQHHIFPYVALLLFIPFYLHWEWGCFNWSLMEANQGMATWAHSVTGLCRVKKRVGGHAHTQEKSHPLHCFNSLTKKKKYVSLHKCCTAVPYFLSLMEKDFAELLCEFDLPHLQPFFGPYESWRGQYFQIPPFPK